VKVCPCQTIVPLYRKHVFAQIKPTTRTRIDLGLALKDAKVPRRLINTGGFAKKDRITHRIEIASVKDIDGEVKKWIKKAYDMDKCPAAALIGRRNSRAVCSEAPDFAHDPSPRGPGSPTRAVFACGRAQTCGEPGVPGARGLRALGGEPAATRAA